MQRYFMVYHEILMRRRFPACSKAAGEHIETMTCVYDFADVTVSTLSNAFELIQFGTKTANDYYPETLHKCFVVNAPFVMPMIWGVVKSFLDEKTARKVTIIGSNYLKTLTEEIDPD